MVFASKVFHVFMFFLVLFLLLNFGVRLEFHGKRDVFCRVSETEIEPESNNDEVLSPLIFVLLTMLYLFKYLLVELSMFMCIISRYIGM